MNIVLASNSPRRTQILTQAKIPHVVIPSTTKEIVDPLLSPIQVVESLAYQKAIDVYKNNNSSLVIGADTIVVVDNLILGKPTDKNDAIRMLQMIQNKTHQVITGVAIIYQNQKKLFHEVTNVSVKKLTLQQINDYIDNEFVYDKAGSYAIQGIFKKYITSYTGEYENVVGLPIKRLKEELKEYIHEIQ